MHIISRMKGESFSSSFSSSLCPMESRSRALAKLLLTLLGFCLWGAAVLFVFGGAFVIVTYKSYRVVFQNAFFPLLGFLVLVMAFLLFPAGALATGTPVKHPRLHRGALMYLLVVLFCLGASSAVLTHLYATREADQLTSGMSSLFHRYNRTDPNHPGNEAMDGLQRQLRCCGIYNYTDWNTQALSNHYAWDREGLVPQSCCKEEALDCTPNVSQPGKLFEDGCLPKLGKRLRFVQDYMNWCCVMVGCLGMLTVISNGVLMKQQPFQDFRILDSANFS